MEEYRVAYFSGRSRFRFRFHFDRGYRVLGYGFVFMVDVLTDDARKMPLLSSVFGLENLPLESFS